MIIVDPNELGTNKKIAPAFKKMGVAYILDPFGEGDYTNDKRTFFVERKGMGDFWSSMVDHRIDKQARGLWENYIKNRYFFIQHATLSKLALERRKSMFWIYKQFGKLENWGVMVREYYDFDDFVLKLNSLDKYMGSERVVRHVRKKLKGSSSVEKVLMAFPLIGEKKAILMLKQCGSLYGVCVDIVKNDGNLLSQIIGIKKNGSILNKAKEILTKYHV